MSYSVDWIDAIFDRTYEDVSRVESNPLTTRNKGAFNAVDLNRIENNTKYCAEYMLDIGIIVEPVEQSYKMNWSEQDVVSSTAMMRIISNIIQLMELSNPKVKEEFDSVQVSYQMSYVLANALEKNLDLMHTQPPYVPDEHLLTIEHGSIYNHTNPGYIIEGDTVNIIGYPYGPSAQYMEFEHWSGNTEDLQYIGDVNSQNTTFHMPDHDVTLTAVFKISIPYMLTLTDATINDTTGGTSRLILSGTTVDILADVAPVGKRFYCWEGTEEALSLLVSGIYASTNTFTMPAMAVELHPKYINAGQHSVTITDTDGRTVISQDWYDYGDYVSISAPSKGAKQSFSFWSGDTSYLTDITSAYQSFNMKDENLRFTPSYSYVYGYHYVLADTNCLANGEEQLNGFMETSNIQMSLATSFENTLNSNNVFDCYELYQMSNIQVDSQTGKITHYDKTFVSTVGADVPNTTFRMPDYDLFIKARSGTPYTLTVTNLNDDGSTTTYKKLPGRTQSLTTSSIVNQDEFLGWYRNNTLIDSRNNYTYTFGSADDTIEARYQYKNMRRIVVRNRNNAGSTEIIQVLDGHKTTINTTEIPGDYIIDTWLFGGQEMTSMRGKTTWESYVYSDFEIDIVYRARETYTVTIQNGTISDYGQSYTGLERSRILINADTPANKKYFSGWSTTSGSVYKYDHSDYITTYLELGRSDATVEATYGDLYDLTVNTSDGVSLQGQYRANTKISLPSSTLANEDTEWDKWTVRSGLMSIVNPFLMTSDAYTGTQDTIVDASYKEIPYYTLHIINGVFSNGETTITVMRNSNVLITMDSAPEGQAFLIWEIVSGNTTFQAPRAEQTYLTNITANATVRATYYTPDDELRYTLSITNKNGATTVTSHAMGDQVNITADTPDNGYEFYRWSGDTNYVEDRYLANTNVLIPGKNINLYMVYRRTGYTTLYDVELHNGKMLVGMSGETEIWESEGQFEEGAIVQIQADAVPAGYKFNGWRNTTDGGASMSTVNDLTAMRTYLTVENFDIELTASNILEGVNALNIRDGEVSGAYSENTPVSVYFSKTDTNTVRYVFNEWTGDTNLELFAGGNFDVTDDGGRGSTPQTIRMPDHNVDLVATYTTEYKITLVNGKFQDTSTVKWIEQGDEVTITADTIAHKTFSYWYSSVNGVVTNIYNPTTTITVGHKEFTVTAVYVNENEPNGVGFVLTSLYDYNTIDTEAINIISGQIDVGFLISDNTGHLYVITSYSDGTANILRLTQRWEVE